MASSLNRP